MPYTLTSSATSRTAFSCTSIASAASNAQHRFTFFAECWNTKLVVSAGLKYRPCASATAPTCAQLPLSVKKQRSVASTPLFSSASIACAKVATANSTGA